MKKEFLEKCLAEGMSLHKIGTIVGKDPSTVSYHLKRHGLRAVNHEKYAGKGGLAKGDLGRMVAKGMSWTEMARELDRSQSTVRYWLKKHGLWPLPATGRRAEARKAREQGARYVELECARHGRSKFVLENRGYHRCTKCRAERVSEWRRRTKRRLIEAAGGRCVICGYDKHPRALHFHHLDPAQKQYVISRAGHTRSFAEVQAEAEKCVLLCANCHAEVEANVSAVPENGVRGARVPRTSQG